MINALEPCAVLFDRYCNWLKRVKFVGKYGRWEDDSDFADLCDMAWFPELDDTGFILLFPDDELDGVVAGVIDVGVGAGFGFGFGTFDDELTTGTAAEWCCSTSVTLCKLKCGRTYDELCFGLKNPKKSNDWTDTIHSTSVRNNDNLKLWRKNENY